MNLTRGLVRAAGYGAVALLLAGMVSTPVANARPLDPQDGGGAVISLHTPSPTIQGCGVTRVEIWAENIAKLYGIDVRFTFDPAVLQVVDAEPGTSGTQITPLSTFLETDFVVRKVACNTASATDPNCPTAGTVWYAVTQTYPTAPVSGSGPLAAVDFVGSAEGLSTLQIYSSEPVDISGVTIPAAVASSELATAAPGSPALGITVAAADTASLTWSPVANAGQYWLYRGREPYFAAAEPAFATTSVTEYQDAGAVGNPDAEHYYVVKAGCSSGFLSGTSNRVGEFDYVLLPGL